MKTFLNTLFFLVSASSSVSVLAYPEIPFCPAGGAPGWMNYLDYKRNQNRWQHNYYSGHYPPINSAQFNQYTPNYTPHIINQNAAPASYHTPYRSVETIDSRYDYNTFPNDYRNMTYPPHNSSRYMTPIR
jgi:hypothetical protein